MDAGAATALAGVPETMLWTLHQRAAEARRPDTVLPDPEAVSLVEAVDFPFVERFGHPHTLIAQCVAQRAACFDRAVRHFLADHPSGTVVSLGEGLETEFWRVDNGTVRWLTVDLPEPLALRRSLLPHGPRRRTVACDVRDPAWADAVDPGGERVLVLAQGLLMYLRPAEVRELIVLCADRFPGGGLVFDAMPRPFGPLGGTTARIRVSGGYRFPPMPWRMDAGERPRLMLVHPDVAAVTDVQPPPGRGLLWGLLAPQVDRLPLVRARRPSVTLLTFADR